MFKITFCLICVSFFCVACTSTPPQELKYGNTKDFVILQNPYLPKYLTGFSSGVVFSRGLIVTNRHAQWDVLPQYAVMFESKEKLRLLESWQSTSMDILVFQVDCRIRPVFSIAADPVLGGPVETMGASSTPFKQAKILHGEVLQTSFSIKHRDVEINSSDNVSTGFLYSVELPKGFSGGPVWNAEGALVGINQGRISKVYDSASAVPDQTAFAYPISAVIRELELSAPEVLLHCKE